MTDLDLQKENVNISELVELPYNFYRKPRTRNLDPLSPRRITCSSSQDIGKDSCDLRAFRRFLNTPLQEQSCLGGATPSPFAIFGRHDTREWRIYDDSRRAPRKAPRA